MVYTTAKFDESASAFPAPPEWLVWIEQPHWDQATRTHTRDGKGIVRHLNGLFKAKKYVRDYTVRHGVDEFTNSWSVYKWDWQRQKYVRQYRGIKGDPHRSCILMQEVVRKGDPNVREVGDDEMQEVLVSIAKAGV